MVDRGQQGRLRKKNSSTKEGDVTADINYVVLSLPKFSFIYILV